jgi:hypothetical protein
MKPYLINGPLMTTIERRQALTLRMAKDLVVYADGLASDRDAVRVLLAKGYHHIDVAILAGEARMLAYQEVVAREMSRP